MRPRRIWRRKAWQRGPLHLSARIVFASRMLPAAPPLPDQCAIALAVAVAVAVDGGQGAFDFAAEYLYPTGRERRAIQAVDGLHLRSQGEVDLRESSGRWARRKLRAGE